ncbi:MAG: hypothetical protein JWN26_623 [Candidatus Saccharibacteria bacterium]|nr:hypothetical protein [Candidatus Saccharibacteria bacterium]
MSDLNPRNLIEQYLAESKIMQLATSRDDKPWICSLHYAADKNGFIYWITKPTTRHSEDIAVNSNVAITIAVKTDRPLVGIQAEGTATAVEDPELLKSAMEVYIERHGTDRAFADLIIAGTNEHKLYQFTPSRYSLFDEVNFAHQPPQEWVIDHN